MAPPTVTKEVVISGSFITQHCVNSLIEAAGDLHFLFYDMYGFEFYDLYKDLHE